MLVNFHRRKKIRSHTPVIYYSFEQCSPNDGVHYQFENKYLYSKLILSCLRADKA